MSDPVAPGTLAAIGALAGLGLGIGLVTVWWRLAARRVRFADRVGPYVRARRATSTLLPASDGAASALERLIAPVVGDVGKLLERLGSSSSSIRRRLALAGGRTSVDAFRVEQVAWGAAGLALGLALAIVIGVTRGVSPVPLAVLVALAAVAGMLLRDRRLTRQVRAREARIMAEFPTVAELLALAVSAGEAPVAALDRVARSTQGELSAELGRTLADVRAGATMAGALEGLARRTDLPAVSRFADGVAVAIERGSPLADVLRAQAADARDAGKRELMESGGRKEVAMMIPVVFLVLPVTVVFALFPGLAVLRVGF
ncbi:type II secretion system protein [Beutenbergia cavernae DSM 12333]|uniref:Type II secretion system protein n=1 Tax=Beutenbergia cavernae (strain ATCC BAA-8 / DSM 12333 / CCUG 43141 / JCM 11478 / NBRC 16432 / NCIMB 13614 / HKI 0122) TaxID=471853 RepID=C5BYD4_BEUC1|nr:type II secretion system F family protein [Beutenbergia cavernae]ACQ81034.1 type II secretion system protein [Beutenbergia cavernae DSM 12333]